MNRRHACVVVLVEPQGPRNVGAICRTMRNFGLAELRLVTPRCDHLGEEARRMAVRSSHVLEEARVCPSLAEAVADCGLVFGTTRRFGRYRADLLLPEEAARLVAASPAGARAAYVFGREDNGLSSAELEICHRFLTIPTSEDLPSMNLAQSVAVCLYELFRADGNGPAERRGEEPAAHAEHEAMIRHMRKSLLAIGYLNPENPDHILRTYRRIFGRAGLSERDIRILQGLWSKLDWLAGQGDHIS